MSWNIDETLTTMMQLRLRWRHLISRLVPILQTIHTS